MKWAVWVGSDFCKGKPYSDTCEADSHQEAVRAFRLRGVRGGIVVEPLEEPGKCHLEQFHTKAGPVLTQEDLLTRG